ncbi:MAG: stage V sporulation protein T [Clostridiales bacterium]|jgi:AbrB family transcriptional regulator (stage V sporulation protein T)|nr:stage V sporulation protein T [Clostridiales bacterium]
MKATGIVRRIDDLGRVVIPKEIRRTMRIREGDPLEIYTGDDGDVILKKYSPMGEITDFAAQYAESLARTSGYITCISDRDSIIAVSGAPKKEFLEKKISPDLERIMEERSTIIAKSKNDGLVSVLEDDKSDRFTSQVITPIIAHGDPIGAVILLSTETAKGTVGEVETKLAQAAAGVLGKQLEQ